MDARTTGLIGFLFTYDSPEALEDTRFSLLTPMSERVISHLFFTGRTYTSKF